MDRVAGSAHSDPMDVRRSPGGNWAADCDCGKSTLVATEVAAWLWLANHECAPLPVPEQRAPRTDDPARVD